MISIQKLMQNLMQCRDSNLVLPRLNDSEENPYVQKTAIDLRRIELEKVEEVFTQLNESNFTMDKELEAINRTLEASNGASRPGTIVSNTIPPESLIIYVENETAPLPEVILNLLRAAGKSQDEWYIYGVKNPESFYKSFLLLTQLDFIIKNKTEKKNEVATFKREMALHYETFYKTLEYRKLRLPHHDMIHKLTSVDNYCGYDAIRFLCDYCQVNIIILDIIEKKYLDVCYIPNKLVQVGGGVVKKPHLTSEFIIIIKYAAETYLPLMNSSGTHIFTQKALDHISRNYERIVVDKFKEPAPDADTTEEYINPISSGLGGLGALGDTNELNLSDIEEPEPEPAPAEELELEESGNFLDSKTVSVFFNNTIPRQEKEFPLNPIIKAGGFSMAIEDMIEISDIPVPSQDVPVSSTNTKEDKFTKLLDAIPVSNNTTSKSDKPVKPTKAKVQNKAQTKSKSPDAALLDDSETIQSKVIPAKVAPMQEELKPIKVYNLLDLQMLARVHKIETQKEGKAGKKVNKTKEEMYAEIKEKLGM